MKKNYETPSVEKVAFQYRDQVVVASGREPQLGSMWQASTQNCDTHEKPDYNN